MLLKELLAGRMLPVGAAELAISGLTADSRAVAPGFLFAAIPGTALDGAKFVPDAIAKGAAAILADESASINADIPVVHTDNPRRALALAAAKFFGVQPEWIVAVTGTNGKTSVASFARQIWVHLGIKAATLGTLGAIGADGVRLDVGAALTTPDSVGLHRLLKTLADDDVQHVALEASSHGLDQFRLDGVRVKAAAFTNLTRDHLDYHGTEEKYFAAKMRLFTDLLPEESVAIIDVDGPYGVYVVEVAEQVGHAVWRVGREGDEIRIVDVARTSAGQHLKLKVFDVPLEVTLPLAGDFQVSNALLAAGLVMATGADPEEVIAALAHLQGVPGRLQLAGRVARAGGEAAVYIDYAHTPDALRTVLETIRPFTEGLLHVVFGCGGDRDAGKRPLMGMIAAGLADRVIVTDDNPRSEVPAKIRREILEAIPETTDLVEIGDRAAAIAEGVQGLGAGDVLIIAGKGHETGQTIGKVVLPFDDVEVARSVIAQQMKGVS